jgi:hypothetical protein
MHAGWRAVESPSIEAQIADAAHGGDLLQLSDVPRFHQGPLADALSRSHARVCPAAGNASHDCGPARAGVVLPEDVPNYPAHTGKLMWKLLAAWVLMGFRTPKVEGVPA